MPVIIHEKVELVFNESNQLMANFLKSIETAKGNDEQIKK